MIILILCYLKSLLWATFGAHLENRGIPVILLVSDYSEHLLSTDDPETLNTSPRKLDKRYAVCKEMLETEENYLRALKIIVQVSVALLRLHVNKVAVNFARILLDSENSRKTICSLLTA